MGTSTSNLLQLKPLFEWLQADPDVNASRELLAVQEHYHAMADLCESPERMADLLDLCYVRMLDLARRFRVPLMESGLPLNRQLRLDVSRVADLCVDLAASYLQQALHQSGGPGGAIVAGNDARGARALGLLSEAWVMAAMASMAHQYEFWSIASRLFVDFGGPGRDSRTTVAYKRLLALAVIQPEGFSAREIAWVADFLEEQAGLARLEPLTANCCGGYWLDPCQDLPPVAMARRSPPPVEGLLHLATAPLAHLVTKRLEYLEPSAEENLADPVEAMVAATVHADLPEGLTARELVALLRRLREHWAMPPLRELPRRNRQYTVQVCLGLRSIWNMSRRDETEASAAFAEWEVINESSGGLALISVVGASTLNAGMALALRRKGELAWSLGVVRWIRTQNPFQMEVGVQLVARGATPVRLGFGGDQVGEMVPGLLVQPMGTKRSNQAILAPAGTYTSPRFVFIHEDDRLHVTQGHLLSLDFQTTSVELFQFEVDPYLM